MPVCISISFLLSPLSSHFSNFIANSSIQHYIKRYILAFVLNTIGLLTTTQGSKHHYSYPILERDTSSYHPTNENSDHHQHYRSQSSSNRLQKPESNIIDAEIIRKDPFQSGFRRVLLLLR